MESIIKAQRIMCCKKFANSQQSSWKIILSHYLRQIGGRLLLSCNFNVKKLPITLPKFYVECLLTFSEHSASVREQILNLSNSSRSSTVIWDNRHILIDGKSVFYQSLFDQGIITLENLVTDTNVLNILTRSWKQRRQVLSGLLLPPALKNFGSNEIQIVPHWINHIQMTS